MIETIEHGAWERCLVARPKPSDFSRRHEATGYTEKRGAVSPRRDYPQQVARMERSVMRDRRRGSSRTARSLSSGRPPRAGPVGSIRAALFCKSGLPWRRALIRLAVWTWAAGEPSVSVLFVLLITLAVGFLVYRIIADGFRRPQSERLGCFGAFGYFALIILGVWLATTVASRFF